MKYKFTHIVDSAAHIVIQNALIGGKKKLSALTLPWFTCTDPEIAHTGMYERNAQGKGIEVDIFKTELAYVDRTIADGGTYGFVKVIFKKGTDKILGVTIVARHAGEMISEITFPMTRNMGLGALSNVIYP